MTTNAHQVPTRIPNHITHFLCDVRRNGAHAAHAEPLLEEAILTVLRRHNASFLKPDGRVIRVTRARALVRFLLEHTRGNQARAATLTGINRNTLRQLIQYFGIDWKSVAAQ